MSSTVKGYQFGLEINTGTLLAPVYAPICLMSFDVSFNEVVEEWATICDAGYSRSEVVGMAPEISVAFKNATEDTDISAEGIKFLYSKQWGIEERNDVGFKLLDAGSGNTIEFIATLSEISYSIEAQAIQEVSATLKFKGMPTIIPPTPLVLKTSK